MLINNLMFLAKIKLHFLKISMIFLKSIVLISIYLS